MKKILFITLLSYSLLTATVTNDAIITIGDGVTMRVDGDFVNNGTVELEGNGMYSTSGSITGNPLTGASDANRIGFFGGCNFSQNLSMIPQFNTIVIEGDAVLDEGFGVITSALYLEEGHLTLNGSIGFPGPWTELVQTNGTMYGSGWIGPLLETGGFYMSNGYSYKLYPKEMSSGGVNGIDKHYTAVYYHSSNNTNHTIVFNYLDYELNGLQEEDLALFAKCYPNDENSSCTGDEPWIYIGGDVDAENNTITAEYQSVIENNTWDLGEYTYWTAGIHGCADPTAINYNQGAFGGAYTCSYNYEEPFHTGANLMSFYGGDGDNSIQNVMESIEMASSIIGEGVAAQKLPNGSWVGALTEINSNDGYWIILADSDTTSFVGQPIHADIEYNLNSGANLISYPNPECHLVGDALPDAAEQHITSIIAEGEAASKLPNGAWVGSLTDLCPWKGYWFMSSSSDVNFVFENASVLPRADIVELGPIPEAISFNQSTKQSFYFIEDIEGASTGDYIVALYGDKVVGAIEYYGEYTTVPVMGNDGQPYSNGYVKDNESVVFKVWNEIKGFHSNVIGQTLPTFTDMGIHMIGMMEAQLIIPDRFTLHQAYPNPFNPVTTIKFELPLDTKVSLEVYDISGRLIETLLNINMLAGYHQIDWSASHIASGAYFVKIKAGNHIDTQKITLIK